MILSWKAVALDAFQAKWQGITLLLQREKDDGRWSLTLLPKEPGAVMVVNDLPSWTTSNRWTGARAGMQAVDESLTRIIMRETKSHGDVVINRLKPRVGVSLCLTS